MKERTEDLICANYVVGFVDILGQRAEYEGQGLLPHMPDGKMPEAFAEKLKNTIGVIRDIHKTSEKFLSGFKTPSTMRDTLPPELKAEFDRLRVCSTKHQRWSDGIVYFQSLSESHDPVPMNGVFGLTAALAHLCFLGLAKKAPIRGGIEIAWAVELEPGEIYGAAVARAYEIESIKAQWPRIVVGSEMLKYLERAAGATPIDMASGSNRALAEVVRSWIVPDVDGEPIIDYLGTSFKTHFANPVFGEVYKRACAFIEEQCVQWESKGDIKLAKRYRSLEKYFMSRKPA